VSTGGDVASSTSTILDNKPKREKRADTKQNLILSALGLFAEQGIDAVSMRTINNAAGTKNASAVHYHFGNKLGIIEAVIDFIKAELDRYRLDEVAALEQRIVAGEEANPGCKRT
jgi:AcrR family transcriptional regulator